MTHPSIESLHAELEAARREIADLKSAHAERERFFGLAVDVMLVCDAQGLIERVNPAFTAVLGYEAAEVAGTSLLELVHPDDQSATIGELSRLGTGARTERFENRYRAKAGGYRLLEWTAVFEEGRVYAAGRDITERRRLEREYERQRNEMEEAQRLAHVGSFDLDLSTQESYWSDEMYRIFDVPLGTPVTFEVIMSRTHPDDRAAAVRLMEEGVAGLRDEADFEHRIIRRDGEVRNFRLQAVFVRDAEGRAIKFMGAGQDVTVQRTLERRMARDVEELARANAHKDQFLGILSHELRTPLNAIMGFGSILADGVVGALEPAQARYVDKILVSSESLLALVDDLLDMSRVQAGKFVLEPQPVAIAAVLREAAASLEPGVARAGHAFGHDVPADLPTLMADGQRVLQIVSNLVGNACKYTPAGGAIALTARLDGDRVRVAIADNGIGIAEADRARVFEPFTQIDMSATRPQGGVGLGLSIVKALVEAHGGEVGVESAPGRGSTFWFTLPAPGAGPT